MLIKYCTLSKRIDGNLRMMLLASCRRWKWSSRAAVSKHFFLSHFFSLNKTLAIDFLKFEQSTALYIQREFLMLTFFSSFFFFLIFRDQIVPPFRRPTFLVSVFRRVRKIELAARNFSDFVLDKLKFWMFAG